MAAARGTRGREGFLGLGVDLWSRSRGSEPGGRLCVEFNDPTIFFFKIVVWLTIIVASSLLIKMIYTISTFVFHKRYLFFFKMGAISQPLHQSDAYGYLFFRPFS
jgi:hypothetical protein